MEQHISTIEKSSTTFNNLRVVFGYGNPMETIETFFTIKIKMKHKMTEKGKSGVILIQTDI